MTALNLLNSKGRVYAILWEVWEGGPTHLSMTDLVSVTGLHRESVRRAVRQLERAILVKTKRTGAGKPLQYEIIGKAPGLAYDVPDGSPSKESVFA